MLCNRIDKLIVVLFKVFSLSLKVWSFLINICELILCDLVLSPSSPQHEDDEQGGHGVGAPTNVLSVGLLLVERIKVC